MSTNPTDPGIPAAQPNPPIPVTPPNPKDYPNYLKLRYPNRYTRWQYYKLHLRMLAFWEDGWITQRTVNRFLATISNNPSYGNPLYYGFLRSYLECYRPSLRRARIQIRIIRPVRKAKVLRQYKFIELGTMKFLENNLPDGQLRIMIRLYFETGLRLMELINVKLLDLDIGGRAINGIGKGGKPYRVRYSPKTRELLAKWLDTCPNKAYPFMFYRRRSMTPLRNQASACWYYFMTRSKQLGIDGVHPHRFRHALGHYLRADKGFDLSQVKEKLRHADISTTQIYSPATQEEVDDKIDKEVWKVDE